MAKVHLHGKAPIIGHVSQIDSKYVIVDNGVETIAIPRKQVIAVERAEDYHCWTVASFAAIANFTDMLDK